MEIIIPPYPYRFSAGDVMEYHCSPDCPFCRDIEGWLDCSIFACKHSAKGDAIPMRECPGPGEYEIVKVG